MEINYDKYLTKQKTILKRELNNFIDNLFDNYNIYCKDTNNIINKELLVELIEEKKQTIQCSSLTSSGTRCIRSALPKTLYCGLHKYKQQQENILKTTTQTMLLVEKNTENDITNCEKIFINNTSYKFDGKYLYDCNSNTKVGYYDKEYILTDDPFILENC